MYKRQEDILNNKILKVYQDLSDLDKVFIISTRNFDRSNVVDDNYDYTYLYDLENEEDLYSPYGRNIVVDKNYLKRHKIKSVNGKNAADMIDIDGDVLNILVPQKYKKYERVIELSLIHISEPTRRTPISYAVFCLKKKKKQEKKTQ